MFEHGKKYAATAHPELIDITTMQLNIPNPYSVYKTFK